MAKNPIVLDLTWDGDQRFEGSAEGVSLTLDGRSAAGPSPVQALAFGLASCMAIDVVHILTRGRTEPKAMRVHLEGQRAETDPHRFVRFQLRFEVTGNVPPDRVERAIALSRETYCSVWHSLRTDIAFETAFEVTPFA
jgi:putative redox protein